VSEPCPAKIAIALAQSGGMSPRAIEGRRILHSRAQRGADHLRNLVIEALAFDWHKGMLRVGADGQGLERKRNGRELAARQDEHYASPALRYGLLFIAISAKVFTKAAAVWN